MGIRNETPFKRLNALLAIAVAAASADISDLQRQAAFAGLQGYKSRGKGGKRPRHSSKRFVAQDRRAARKARRAK